MITTRDVWKLQDRKVIFYFDEEYGQHDDDSEGLLGSWLGQFSTDVNLFPINYTDWRNVGYARKDTAWDVIQSKFWFDNPEARKNYVISLLGSRCKALKLRLWRDYKRSNPTETLENCPPNVPAYQWSDLVTTTFTEKWKKLRDRNTRSRSQHKMPHLCGRKSFPRKGVK
ncbi:unnamed protein product [Cochlearia groenlandica]